MRGSVLLGAAIILAMALPFAIAGQSFAGDPTGFWKQQIAEGKAPPPEWWESLHAPGTTHGCCSNADGERVDDVAWDTARDENTGEVHYRVWLLGAWRKVPPAAVVTAPNKYGPAVVWPVYSHDEKGFKDLDYIRCFMPGAGA